MKVQSKAESSPMSSSDKNKTGLGLFTVVYNYAPNGLIAPIGARELIFMHSFSFTC
jgi:hypothetical protein